MTLKIHNTKIVVASLVAFSVCACSGPFGIVIGPESTHNAYNRRIAIERQYVHGNQLTERDRAELQELLNEVK